jgi:hypothetical protein
MTERSKFWSADRRRLFKFEGLGRHGAVVRSRAEVLADSGFGVAVEDAGDGYLSYAMAGGRPMHASDASPAVIERLASYCAMRASTFGTEESAAPELDSMMRTNLALEFGDDAATPRLEVRRPVIADGRMMPHEWIAAKRGIFKVDAVTHGDDHFFPGPVDIAWDLAGVIVEWGLSGGARDAFLELYERGSGDRAEPRIAGYVFAYRLFRLAYAKMAMQSIDDSSERARMSACYVHGRALLAGSVAGPRPPM